MSSSTAMLLVFLILAVVLWLGGCATKSSSSLKCKTETSVKRVCDSEGTGQELIISPAIGGRENTE